MCFHRVSQLIAVWFARNGGYCLFWKTGPLYAFKGCSQSITVDKLTFHLQNVLLSTFLKSYRINVNYLC